MASDRPVPGGRGPIALVGVAMLLVSLWLPAVEVAGRVLNGLGAALACVRTGAGMIVHWRDAGEVGLGLVLVAAASLNATILWWFHGRARRAAGWAIAAGMAATLYLAMRVWTAADARLLGGYFVWIAGIGVLALSPPLRRDGQAPPRGPFKTRA